MGNPLSLEWLLAGVVVSLAARWVWETSRRQVPPGDGVRGNVRRF